jgi:undecaprenyl-diphosphatase
MSYLDAIILGLVQGLTEFLPVSSSGHLVITSHLLGTPEAFTFDVLLNFGTLTALIVFYRVRLVSLIARAFSGKEWSLLAKLAAATIPAVAFGLVFGDGIKQLNEMLPVVIAMLLIVGVIMIRYGSARPDATNEPLEKSLSWQTTLKVGVAQAIALIPGTSRSGITILVGLQSKLSAARAAEFSFLLAIPIILGASLKVLALDGGVDYVANNLGVVLVGNLVSFTSGFLAIGFLIRLLGTRGLKDFGWYRVALASVLTILLITGII